MKEFILKYSDEAKTILTAVATVLVSMGVYDPLSAELIVGGIIGAATAIWQVYETVTKPKVIVKKDEVIVEGLPANYVYQGSQEV